MPVILGVMILAGTIIMLTSAPENEKEPETSTKDSDLSEFNIEEVRRLRSQLKKQLRAKKRAKQEQSKPNE